MNKNAQMRAIAMVLPDNEEADEISAMCSELTFDLCQTSHSRFFVKAFTENRLDIIREYFQLEIQSVIQKFGSKKLRRLKQKMASGSSVFVRKYDKDASDKCSFTYERVSCLKNIAGIGFWKLSDGRWHTGRSLEKRASAAFANTRDWAVYEDINFDPESIHSRDESCRKVYIGKLISSLRCFISSRPAGHLKGSVKVSIDDSFTEQRREVFEGILGLGSGWRKLYRKKYMSGSEFIRSLKKEQKMLEALLAETE